MHDDATLEQFLQDPIKGAEDDHGLTKAERSVLRRVVAGISHNSTNGMALHRSLNSYRRSIRLVQNVLHKHSGHMLAQAGGNTITLYYGPDPSSPGSNPYANYVQGVGSGSTIADVLGSVSSWTTGAGEPAKVSYDTITNGDGTFIISFTINDEKYEAVPGPRTTKLPFWFYSVDGKALENGKVNPDAEYGYDGQPFGDYSVTPGEPIFWQCIAPDVSYGFQPCEA